MKITDKIFDEERALYALKNADVERCLFDGPADGESAFKETSELHVTDCTLRLRYPFWHMRESEIRGCEITETCRAALWYDANLLLADCRLHGIKALRECDGITLETCDIISAEFGWKCRDIRLTNCTVEGEYPFFECRGMEIDALQLRGKYSFQYVENAVIRCSVLNTKDAFWHAKNVTVYDSEIHGEYLGWYSENLRLVRCRISGTQPLCYCKNLVLEDCTMDGADFSFENSEVHADVRGEILSVKNPADGEIIADSFGEIIRDEYIWSDRTVIRTRN